MITADTLYAWSRLLATCAGIFEGLADEARPGSAAYLRHLELALRCENAADCAEAEADDALDDEYAAEAQDDGIVPPAQQQGGGDARPS